MCFGSPKAPNIVYQGPSEEEIAANQASLDAFQQQMQTQQQAFQTQLQSQIDAANAQTAQLQEQLGNEQAAAAAAQQASTYATTVQQSEAPESAQTTAARPKKKQPVKTLKINKSLMAASEGAGLNIGV